MYNCAVFKEPRGAMKLLELIVVVSALIVFSTYTGHGNVTIHSLNTTPSVYSFEVDYWFTADEYKFTPDNGGIIGTDEYQGHAEFYSGVGVLAFLYVLGLSACYVFLEPRLVQRKLRQYFVMPYFGLSLHQFGYREL
jgi:hypothetical protein